MHRENEPVVLSRDVEAIMVPAGTPITLKSGLAGFITQALGGSFTLYIEGNLFRLAGICQGIVGRVRDGTAASAHELWMCRSGGRRVSMAR